MKLASLVQNLRDEKTVQTAFILYIAVLLDILHFNYNVILAM